MAMNRDRLESLLREGFPDAKIELIDLAGDNNHWKAVIISPQFSGKSRIAQHQMVYASLKGKMDGADGELHALALETKAPSA